MAVGSKNIDKIDRIIKKIDPSDLKSDYDAWPDLAENSWANTRPQKMHDNPDSILFAGMGGSGIVGALICDYAREMKSPLQFSNLNDYHLPAYLNKKALVVGVSCSGNTEETLSAVSEAISRGNQVASFGSGGLLEEYSKKWNFHFTRTRMLKVPRSSLPSLFFAALKFLSFNKLLKVSNDHVSETIREMRKVGSLCKEKDSENLALNIAKKVVASPAPVLIYTSNRTRAIGLRFRQSMNENAKMHSFNGELPEVCHNDIVGWDAAVTGYHSDEKLPLALLLRLQDDQEETKVRFAILQDLIKMRRGQYLDSPYFGKSYLSRTISMLYVLDYATYYAAILRGIDPIKTPSIEMLKQELGRRLDLVSRLKKQYL